MADAGLKYKDEPWEKTDPKEIVYGLIAPGSFVLDLGCWTGRLGEKLKEEKDCRVVGVDINKEALKIAQKRLDKVWQVDLNEPKNLVAILADNKFDYILAVDVLEHLQNPKELLGEINKVCCFAIKKYLKKQGKLIVSLPNVAYYKIRLSLLRGKFGYEDQGILDRTHLRFFTLFSAREMLEGADYEIEQIFYTRTNILPTLLASQFIFVCKR